jgi:ArsR family transcriptional regulator
MMSAAALEMVARRFKVLGEPMRLRLLHALESGEQSVSALMEATGATQANVSKHLSLLMSAGLVDRRREGLHVYYFISDPMVFELCALVCSGLKRQLETHAEHLG